MFVVCGARDEKRKHFHHDSLFGHEMATSLSGVIEILFHTKQQQQSFRLNDLIFILFSYEPTRELVQS